MLDYTSSLNGFNSNYYTASEPYGSSFVSQPPANNTSKPEESTKTKKDSKKPDNKKPKCVKIPNIFGNNQIPAFQNMQMSNSLSNPFGNLCGSPFDLDFNSEIFDHPRSSFNTRTDLPGLMDTYNPELGGQLAQVAERTASNRNTHGYCAGGVNDSLEAMGIVEPGETRVVSAYQEAEVLDDNPKFKSVAVDRGDLRNLPAGCIVVWDRTSNNEHGHISISLGDGMEASDHVQKQIVYNDGIAYRVFVPVGGLDGTV